LFRVKIERRATKELARLPRSDADRVILAILSLAENPRPVGCVKLSGTKKRLYRIRVSDYRVIYEVQDAILLVLVVRVAGRDEVYRGL